MPVIVPVTVVGAAFAVLALRIVIAKPAKIPIRDKRANLIMRENAQIVAL
jgi:hypothetical protein